MRRILQIASEAFFSTRSNPSWWILVLPQIIALMVLVTLSLRPALVSSPFLFFVILVSLGALGATVYLWMDIDQRKYKLQRQKSLKYFLHSCYTVLLIAVLATVAIALLHWGLRVWTLFALISSLISSTAVLAMLFAVLCEQTLSASLVLALDTWSKKVGLAAGVTLVLVLCHGAAFAFSPLLGQNAQGRFELSLGSATIWVVLIPLLVAAAVFAAFLNCFLVFLFLETIRRKKDAELAENPGVKPAWELN